MLDAVDVLRPDVVVVDVRMPPTYTVEGLRAALKIRSRYPGVGVLVLSQHLESRYAVDLVTSGGGVGYLLKERVGDVASFATPCGGWAPGAPPSTPRWWSCSDELGTGTLWSD
jgi:DNA-binding NarL/FixJ family response regulator